MDITVIKPTRFILPTQEVMERVYSTLSNRYLPVDTLLLVYLKYHRDTYNEEAFVQASPYELFQEYRDTLESLVIKFNANKNFADFIEHLDSSAHDTVLLGYRELGIITQDLYSRIVSVAELLDNVIYRMLPESFYLYQCEPVAVRLYAGDLVITFNPTKTLGLPYVVK